MATPPGSSPSSRCSFVRCAACPFAEAQSESSSGGAVNHGEPGANHSGRTPAAQALCGVSGRALGSFTTFLSRPPPAGQRAPGSWGCAHTRLCLLRVASGLRKGTINTARPGSETERRDSKAAAQPLLPLGCVRRETLSASLGTESSFDILGVAGITGPSVELLEVTDLFSRNRAQPMPQARTLNPFCALSITLSHMKLLIFDLLRWQFHKIQVILVTSDHLRLFF